MTKHPDLSSEYKKSCFEARKYNGQDSKLLNDVLNRCMDLVQKNELGQAIIAGAEYGKATTKDNYTVEEIYIGNRGKIQGGHCGLISAIENDKNPNNARGEIYLSENFVRNVVDKLGKENGAIYLSNIVVHEFLHGNQRKHDCITNVVENSRSGLGKPAPSGEKPPLTPEQMTHKYENIQEDKDGWARMLLTEAASMTAGLNVCMQLCDETNREDVIKYALEDMKNIGNVSEESIKKIEEKLREQPKTTEEKQNLSLTLFKIIVNGEMEYQRTTCGNRPLGIEFAKYEASLNATYHNELFGSRENFNTAIKCIDGLNKSKDQKLKNNDGNINLNQANTASQTLLPSVIDMWTDKKKKNI